MLGGAVGAVTRYEIAKALPPHSGLAWATFVINISGAFVLGLVTTMLARGGPDVGLRQHLRLLVCTGFCGAFTTYSTFAHDVTDVHPSWHATLWGLLQVCCGFAAAFIGVLVAERCVPEKAENR